MSRESFRREISRTFDSMSGTPSPALSARVRSALAQDRPARTGPFWMAGVAAAVIAAIVVGVFVVASFNRHQSGGVPAGQPSASPSPEGTPTVGSNLPAFTCAASTGFDHLRPPSAPTVAYIDAVRTGTHAGYERITIEFANGNPMSAEVSPQSGTTFTQGASGQLVMLAGQAGMLVTIKGADEHTAYSGPADIKPGYTILLELRQVQDFEGTVQWGMGLSKPACYRAFFLAPLRLVIDIQDS